MRYHRPPACLLVNRFKASGLLYSIMASAQSHIPALVRHVRAAVSTYGHTRVELEWRLGHRQGQFRPGVGADAWKRLQAVLDGSPAFQSSFKESTELMGDAAGMKCIRDPSGNESWMHKKRLADVDSDSDKPWGVRASVSLEDTDSPAPPPHPGTQIKYERHKRRWSYRHACWSVDLTAVRSNLPSHLDEDEHTYEVEIELVDQGILFEKTVEHVVEWGYRLADDMMELMHVPCEPTKAMWADM